MCTRVVLAKPCPNTQTPKNKKVLWGAPNPHVKTKTIVPPPGKVLETGCPKSRRTVGKPAKYSGHSDTR